MNTASFCEACGGEHYRHHLAKFCMPCVKKRNRESAKRASRHPNNIARQMVGLAVRRGMLRPASEYLCVDCGDPAKHYDHRDYNKPLDVVPVCVTCNGKRGRGIELQLAEPGPIAPQEKEAA